MQKLGGAFLFLFFFAASLSAQTVTGRVTLQADGSPLPGVTVSADGGPSTITDVDGRYVLAMPGATGTVRVTAMLQGFQTRSASVDLARESTHDFVMRVSFGQEITVGSRAIGAEQEKAVPVDVIPQEFIRTAPSTETNQIIQKIAPSFNFPRPTISDGSDTVRPATLRGLGPDQLLVMLNGKRRHASALVAANNTIGRGSSGVDLNAIPASAIGSIEILRDGAAAQYGSDAIAGVINLVLKSDVQPLQLDVKTGMTTHSDGEMLNTALSGGWGVGRGALVVAGEYRVRYETNRANPDPREQIVPGDGGNNEVPQPNTHWGDSYARDIMVFSNFNLPVTEDSKQVFYAFGGFSNRHGSHGGNYRRALQNENWREIYPIGFLPLIQPRVVDASLTGGMRGQLATWFYDLSAGYGQNKFDFHVTNSLNSSLGPTSQTNFYAGSVEDSLLSTNLDVSRPFQLGLAGPVNVAWGLEFRRDTWEQFAGEPNSYINGGVRNQNGGNPIAGAQVFPGYQPSNEVDVSRNSKAIYLDLEGDVLPKLRLGLAGRFEDFSDFGNTTNGKFTARYSVLQQLILRGSVSTGFRAPSLSQGNWSAISTNFILNQQTQLLEAFQVGTYRVGSPVANALGAPALRPEDSKNLSAGFVWQPLSNLEVTADYFDISVDDRIVYTGNFNNAAIQAIIVPLGANGARFLTNAINTETKGYDVVANYQRPLFSGSVDLSAAYSNNETKIVGTVATPPLLSGLGEVLFDRQERRRIECGQPEDNLRLMQSFTAGGLNVTTRESRYGEYCSLTLLPIDDQTYQAEWIADAEVSYRWSDYTFALGAENIFDNFPDRNRMFRPGTNPAQLTQQAGAGGTNSYPINSVFGMNGTFIYTRIGYTF
jgi:iron complex outermembrane recepter protein